MRINAQVSLDDTPNCLLIYSRTLFPPSFWHAKTPAPSDNYPVEFYQILTDAQNLPDTSNPDPAHLEPWQSS